MPSVQALKKHYNDVIKPQHLRDLLKDEARNQKLVFKFDDANPAMLDLTHTKIDATGLDLLLKVADEVQLKQRVQSMFSGEVINKTEKRKVWHVKLRESNGQDDMAKEVDGVRQRIKAFSDKVRSGDYKGFTDKKLSTVVAIGIGGSYLGPEFVHEALKFQEARQLSQGRQLKFLANVDPIDFERATEGLDVESTLFIIVSKTFTTAETMMNARLCREFIRSFYASKGMDVDAAVSRHLCAVSTNLTATKEFGIPDENVFGFWDWVGGRFSVSSAVGVLPLCLQYGYETVKEFLAGLESCDQHFLNQANANNVPAMLGMIGFYNTYICEYNSRAVLPYCQALLRFPAHIQQLDMESNGKSVTLEGKRFAQGVETGPIIFGEPGTNGQHSFYQLMH